MEINARTGCVGCPLASKEAALEAILALPDWSYLAPLSELKPVYRALRERRNRLRKPGLERLKSGGIASNPQRMGPLTFEAREWALASILDIQQRCNDARGDMPEVDILNADEAERIRELIAAETWPDGWDGTEPVADVPLDTVYPDGTIQPLLL